MPQPFHMSGARTGRGMLRERPEICCEIADILSQWTRIEDSLVDTLGVSFGDLTFGEDGDSYSMRHSWPASVAMSAAETIRARVKLVERALLPLLPDNLANDWKAIARELNNRAKERNVVAHTVWWISDDFTSIVVRQTSAGESLKYTRQDFVDIGDRIEALRKLLYTFQSDVVKAIRNGNAPKLASRGGTVTAFAKDR